MVRRSWKSLMFKCGESCLKEVRSRFDEVEEDIFFSFFENLWYKKMDKVKEGFTKNGNFLFYLQRFFLRLSFVSW